MALLEIRAALEIKLNALLPSVSTAWEGVPFTPTVGVAFQQVNLMMTDTANPTMGGGHYRVKGFMQVLLCYPPNAGAKAAAARADLLIAHFKRGTSLINGGVTVIIDKTPAIGPALIDGERYKLPISVYFLADIYP